MNSSIYVHMHKINSDTLTAGIVKITLKEQLQGLFQVIMHFHL